MKAVKRNAAIQAREVEIKVLEEEVVIDNPKNADYAGHYGDYLALYDR